MSRFAAAAEAALTIARARHLAIREGDFERYDSLGESLFSACNALESAPYGAPEMRAIDELIALETASARLLQDETAQVSQRLVELASRARTMHAYGRSESFSVNAG